MQTENKDAEQISTFITERIEAIRKKDVNTAVSHYAEAVILCDVIGPLQQSGSGLIKERLENWFSTFQGDIGFEISNLIIEACQDIAFCHSFNHVNGILKSGGTIDMWWRETLCWKKINEEWMVTYTHSSVPFDVTNGMASVGLKP
jgi:ketosteroid isomerase-like protein